MSARYTTHAHSARPPSSGHAAFFGQSAGRRPYQVNNHSNSVSPQPADAQDGFFNFDLASSFQCVKGKQYRVAEDSAERAHFTHHAASLIKDFAKDAVTTLSTPSPFIFMVAKRVEEAIDQGDDVLQEVLVLEYIECGQLRPIHAAPPGANRADHVPDTNYESFEVGKKQYVQAPKTVSDGGAYYEILSDKQLKHNISFLFRIDLGGPDVFNQDEDGDGPYGAPRVFLFCFAGTRAHDCGRSACTDPPLKYGMQINFGERGRRDLYDARCAAKQHVTRIALGHFCATTGRLMPWRSGFKWNTPEPSRTICIVKHEACDQMFELNKWRLVDEMQSAVAADEGGFFDVQPMQQSVTSRGKWTFVVDKDDQLCYEVYDGRGSPKEEKKQPIVCGNFCIPEILAIYQFKEAGEAPIMKLLCRRRLLPKGPDGTDVVVRIHAEDDDRAPSLRGATVLEVEAMVYWTLLKNATELKAAFANSSNHAILQTESDFNPAMLSCYLNSIPQPLPSSVIVRWGFQPSSGWWVLHNVAFKDGKMDTVEGSGHGVAPGWFNSNPITPMPTTSFPRIVIIPFAHVRYAIGMQLWCDIMPKFFQNNELPAKAVFAFAVLGLHATKCWGGETGLGHGMPVAWIHSAEWGSGKTESCLLANSAIGLFHRGIWAGDATQSATGEGVSLDCCLTKIIDDVVVGPDGVSKPIAVQVRTYYDRSTRAVTGKLRQPNSTCAYSSNSIVNESDKPMQSRMLTIPFSNLKCSAEDSTLYDRMKMSQELVSALMPDLAQVGLWNGKLDKEAIQDWATFLNKALDKQRHRNLNEWAKLGYIYSCLNLTFQADGDEQARMIEWIVVMVTRATYELTNHSSLLDEFIIHVLKVREEIGVNVLGPCPEKIVFWHNLRTTEVPPLCSSRTRYWAIRVDRVCHVIKALLGRKFSPQDIHRAVAESDHGVANSRAKFYDMGKGNPWPIKESIVPDAFDNSGQLGFVDVPLQEDRLLPQQLTEQRCVFIKTDYINSIRDSLQKNAQEVGDYKQVVIKSANKDIGEYNFFERLTGGDGVGWWGYRSLTEDNNNFRTFCGAANELKIGFTGDCKVVQDVETETAACGFGSIAECYHPATLLEYFGYEHPSSEALKSFPPCFTKVPFEFRNAPGDETPMDPLGDVLTAPPSALSTPTKTPAAPARATALSPARPTNATRTAPSPLATRNRNARGDADDEPEPPIKRRRRIRASPTNHARYPRPPDEVNSVQTARQWSDYARARGLVAATGGKRNQFVLDEAEDEDNDEVSFSVPNSNIIHDLTLSYACPHRRRARRPRPPRTVPSSTTLRTTHRATATSTRRASAR